MTDRPDVGEPAVREPSPARRPARWPTWLAMVVLAGMILAVFYPIPDFEFVEVATAEVPFADAVKSYLFNAQLVTPPDGEMTLVAPTECRDTPSVKAWIDRHLASNGAIRRVNYVDVRQSMANGGGPACLRLRVQCDPDDVDPRFMVDEAKCDLLSDVVSTYWPEEIDPADLQSDALVEQVENARSELLDALDLMPLKASE